MATVYRRTCADDSDDEIVWNPSNKKGLAPSPSYSLVSDFSSDFVILSHPLSPSSYPDPSISQSRPTAEIQRHAPITATFNVSLTEQVAKLQISGSSKGSAKEARRVKPPVMQKGGSQAASPQKQQKKSKKTKRKLDATAAPYPSPSPSPRAQKIAPTTPAEARRDQLSNLSKPTKPAVSRGNPTRDGKSDVRPVVSTTSQAAKVPSLYEEASTFISRFLSNPAAKNDSVCRLTLLQSLIIELGLATSNLPASLNSARAFLKAHAFLNIREYIAVRSQGPEAIRRAMYPSKSALIKNFKKQRGSRAPLQWVKDMGLQVLLVGRIH